MVNEEMDRFMLPNAVRDFHRDSDYLIDVGGSFERLIELANPSPDSVCLDIGCGAGAYSTLKIAQYVKQVIGIDIDKGSLDEAEKKLAKWKSSADKQASETAGKVLLKRMNAETMEFGDAFFDIVVSRGSLRQCAHWEKAFSESVRVLKPSGQLLLLEIVMPADLIDLWHGIDWAQGRSEHYWEYPQLLAQIQDFPIEVQFIIPERAKRKLEDYLKHIKGEKVRDAARKRILGLPEGKKKEMGIVEEGRDGGKQAVFYYPVLHILLRRRTRRNFS